MDCQFIDRTCLCNDDLLKIEDVDYLHDYVLRLKFSNGETRDIDMGPILQSSPSYSELLEPSSFTCFALMPWGVLEWYNGVDFDPLYLYDNGVPVK